MSSQAPSVEPKNHLTVTNTQPNNINYASRIAGSEPNLEAPPGAEAAEDGEHIRGLAKPSNENLGDTLSSYKVSSIIKEARLVLPVTENHTESQSGKRKNPSSEGTEQSTGKIKRVDTTDNISESMEETDEPPSGIKSQEELYRMLELQQKQIQELMQQTKAQQSVIFTLQQKLQAKPSPKPKIPPLRNSAKKDSDPGHSTIDTASNLPIDAPSSSRASGQRTADQEREDASMDWQPAKSGKGKKTPQSSSMLQAAHVPTNEQQPQQQPKSKPLKVPPINIMCGRPQETINLIKERVKLVGKFSSRRINEKKHVIYTENLVDYKQVLEQLKTESIEYYTFTPKSEKIKSYLLKNLEGDFDESEILTELRDQNIGGVEFLKVTRFTTRKSIAENRKLPMFIVQLSPTSAGAHVHLIKRLLFQQVLWEKLKKPDRSQCKRCQGIGHAASNCNCKPRCVKCTDTHPIGECPIKNVTLDIDDPRYIKPKCVLCKGEGHPASYRGCPRAIELKKKVQQKIAQAANKRQANLSRISRQVNPQLPFSAVVAAAASHSHVSLPRSDPPSRMQQRKFQSGPSQQPESQESWRGELSRISEYLEKIANGVALNASRIDAIFLALDMDTSNCIQ